MLGILDRVRRARAHEIRIDGRQERLERHRRLMAALDDDEDANHVELMAMLQSIDLRNEEERICAACLQENRQYSDEEMQNHPNERRCETCVTEGRRCAKRFKSLPVSCFFKLVFGADERKKFDSWMDKNKNILDVLDGDADYENEMNNFDRILEFYDKEYFTSLCKEVDPITRLYPLQKAIEVGFKWEEVRFDCRRRSCKSSLAFRLTCVFVCFCTRRELLTFIVPTKK